MSDPDRGATADRGSVLLMTMVLVLVGGLIVTGLLSYVATVIRVRPPLEERNAGYEAARSGIRMAVTLQRETGADECFSPVPFTPVIDGRTVTVQCETLGTTLSGQGRLALVSTANVRLRDGRSNISGSAASDPWTKPVRGAAFLNAGSLHELTGDLDLQAPPDAPTQLVLSHLDAEPDQPRRRYLLEESLVPEPPPEPPEPPAEPDDPGVVACDEPLLYEPAHFGGASQRECLEVSWTDRVGDRPDGAAAWEYPQLPRVASFLRPGSQAQVGSCSIYFPGRYDAPLDLAGGKHYFASGVYVFNAPVTIHQNADVVAGEGRERGCSFDADAAFAPTAPRNHEITGKGATFVFGDEGRLVVEDASLRINRRVATASTSASDGVAIMSVHAATATPEVTIPESRVRNAAAESVLVTEHEIVPTTGQPPVSYRPSALTASDLIVDVEIGGGDDFYAEGYVFTPGSGVRVATANNNGYDVRLVGGVVASTIELDMQKNPRPSSRFLIGVEQEVVKRRLRLTASASGRSSTAIFEIHRDGSYAINSWTLQG